MLGGLAILVVLLWRQGSDAFLDGLRVIDAGTLLAAAGIGLMTTVFSAWRWCLVARGLGIRLPMGAAVAAYYRALFLNAALPGGVLGDVHRAVRHGRDVDDLGRGVRAVVLERFAGQIVLFMVGAVALLTMPSPVSWPGLVPTPDLEATRPGPAAGLAAGGLVVAGIAGVLVARRRQRRAARPCPPVSWYGRTLRTAVSDVRLGLLARRNGPWIMLFSTLVLAGHLATFLVAARAAGSSAPVTQLLPLALLALLAMALPLSVGGWGPREGVTAWAFGAAGLGASLGLTIAVIYGVLAFAASLPGAAVLLVRWLAGMRAAARERSAVDSPVRPVHPAALAGPVAVTHPAAA
jgi:uncharacterized membrane protein YbhN (UPF0104 family)